MDKSCNSFNTDNSRVSFASRGSGFRGIKKAGSNVQDLLSTKTAGLEQIQETLNDTGRMMNETNNDLMEE